MYRLSNCRTGLTELSYKGACCVKQLKHLKDNLFVDYSTEKSAERVNKSALPWIKNCTFKYLMLDIEQVMKYVIMWVYCNIYTH